ncbi:MAG: c-type cytochrome [Candidatus Omnitrophota bacterium]
MPIPRMIPLPLPASAYFLQYAIVILFLLHIFFVNLMVGASILSVLFEYLGWKKPDYDRLAREVADTITVNKSLAVVLGVAPLLTINVLYTIYFYTANALTGFAWIMVVPLVTIAFLLGYAHKYSWDYLADQKGLHISLGAGAALLFLIIPLIFLANINLMLFPEQWFKVDGWLAALAIPNVIPRYFHFLLACFAITGLFFAGYFSRAKYPVETVFREFDRPALRRLFYSIAFGATGANFLAGPLLFLTLPANGLSWLLILAILCGASLAVMAAVLLWREITRPQADWTPRFYWIAGLLMGTVLFMGTGRHLYRENAVAWHRTKMAEETRVFTSMSEIARWRASQGLGMPGEEALPPGEKVFRNVCAACHALDQRLVGPPLREIAAAYLNDPAGIVKWVKNPGKKRTDYPQMPAVKLTEAQYQDVARYILEITAPKSETEAKPQETKGAAPPQSATSSKELIPNSLMPAAPDKSGQ